MASKIWYDVLSLYSISISLSMCDIAMNYLVSIYHQFFTLISNALQTTAVVFFSSVCCNFATFKSTLLVFFHLQSIQREWLSYLLVHFTLGHRIQNALCYRFRKIFIIIISFRKWIEHFFSLELCDNSDDTYNHGGIAVYFNHKTWDWWQKREERMKNISYVTLVSERACERDGLRKQK